MRIKRLAALSLAAVLTAGMLTVCPWDKEADETDDASSVPVTSSSTSQPSSDDKDDDTPAPPAHLHPHLWFCQHRRDAVTGCFERQRHRSLLFLRPKARDGRHHWFP